MKLVSLFLALFEQNETAIKVMNAVQFCDSGHVYNNFRVIIATKILTLYPFLLYNAEKKSVSNVCDLVFI